MGLAEVAPGPVGFQPEANESSRSRRAGQQREELPDRRHPVGEERAASDDDPGQHGEPRVDRRRGALSPAPHARFLPDVGRGLAAAHVRTEARAPAHLEATDLTFGHAPEWFDRTTPGDQRRGPGHEADQRAQRGGRLTERAGEDADHQLEEREQHQFDRSAGQPPGSGQRGDRPHAMAGRPRPQPQVGAPRLQLAAVTDPSRRCDHDAGAGEVDPPAQLDVVATEVDHRVETADLAEQIGADQHARRRDDEDVAHPVLLLLIDLARFDDLVDLTEPVDAEADRLQHARIVPLDELRANHPGVGPEHLLDHEAHRRRIDGDVVVAEEERTVVALDEPQDLVGRRPEAGVGIERPHERVGQPDLDPRLDADLSRCAVGRQEEEPEVGVILFGEGVERLLEPLTRFVDDDHRHDWRCL